MTAGTDPAALTAADPGGILDEFLSLPEQLAASFAGARSGNGDPFAPETVTFCGMGGSAAAGDVLVAAFADQLLLPMAVHRGYRLPSHCGPSDLVVCLSYSGNTEETTAAYAEAVARGCRTIVVSSGGELAERAAADGTARYGVPEGTYPRAALGHLTGAALGALTALGVVPAPDEDVQDAVRACETLAAGLAVGADVNTALDLASWIGDRDVVVWGSEGLAAPAAWRWKCAFNENAKLPAFASSFPELNHHEVVGWAEGRGSRYAVVVLRHDGEHPSVGPRLAATVETLAPAGLEHREVRASGRSALARVLSLMLLGDVTSALHAMLRGVDPGPIEAIARVKQRLASGGDPGR